MAENIGAMIGGYFLPEKEFKEVASLLLKQKKSFFIMELENALAFCHMEDPYNVYKSWNNFQTEFLKNEKTEMLAIINFYNDIDGINQQWVYMEDEENAIKKDGIIDISSADAQVKSIYTSDALFEHLAGMRASIQGSMNKDESIYLWDLFGKKNKKSNKNNKGNSQILEQLNIAKHEGIYTYKDIFWGKATEFKYRGQVSDAFVNHLGGPAGHWHLIKGFLTGQINALQLIQLKSNNVREEEMTKGGNLAFIDLLLDSLNTTGWQTGGDLIVTDNTGKVISNIQVKTSIKEGKRIGRISYSKLEKNIEKMIKTITNNDNEFIEMFFENLKTSSASKSLDEETVKMAKQLAIEVLGIKNN